MGTIDTIVGALTAKFSRQPRSLIVCILFVLVLAGSLLGDAIAAATVVGMLTISMLISMNISYEKISAIIVMGACIGSIMPPITQALALASSLASTEADPVINIGYITVSAVFIIIAAYCAFSLINKEDVPGANSAVKIKFINQSAGEILKSNWKSLIPMCFLIIVVLLKTLHIPYISVDLGPTILKSIKFIKLADDKVLSLYDFMSGVSILGGLTNGIVLSIICAIGVAFLFPTVHQNANFIFKESFNKVKKTVGLQVCCAFSIPQVLSLPFQNLPRGLTATCLK